MGAGEPIRAEDLVAIVEASMSSETYDLPELPDDAYVHARQVNLETIHKHDVFAERGGTLGELRAEIRDGVPRDPTSLAAWQAAKLGLPAPGRPG